ncbi:nucleotidyltransferase family protein [Paenibacillus sp. N1-5-1-14]|uniref:nucleotidyltransferase family protein n=1 Tax=Paenibacillus radicibacter TaxID=2972488 RepID=UPI00215928A5|nr:nucleotidyltransferase family protein [Paenibacillus radicibacter]MCR8644363.1 nucleotidyltransferase family protein [Paenibacillus radicibacter]
MTAYKDQLLDMIYSNEEMMKELELLRSLQLPDWYVAAGYIRNYVWDKLHGYEARTPLNDIDVVYYDLSAIDEVYECKIEQQLQDATGKSIWSVKNQARMHMINRNDPYTSSEDALYYWVETVTAVGVRLEEDDSITVVCPFGLEDIFEFRVSRNPLFQDEAYYRARVSKKNWQELWPKLKIE